MKRIALIGIGILGTALVFSSLADGGYATLAPMDLPPLNVTALQEGQPCIVKPGNIGDCEEGELLAVLNNTEREEELLRSINLGTGPLQLLNLLPDGLSLLTGSIKFNPNVASHLLAETPTPGQVCGHTLLRFTFTPKDQVTKAIQALEAAIVKSGRTSTAIQPATLYGVQPNGMGKPSQSSTNEPINTQGFNWATRAIRSKSINAQGLPSVRVAVLDTGFGQGSSITGLNINLTLAKDFLHILQLPINPTPPLSIYDNYKPSGTDTTGHGTGVASIIASTDTNVGVAPNAEIVPIKVCTDKGDCLEASVIAGVCYAGSQNVGASVINLSLATITSPKILSMAVQDVTRSGSLVVAAAGNTRDEAFIARRPTPSNPAAFPAALDPGMQVSVGAVFTDRTYAKFATTNARVDLVAPGSWVRLLDANGTARGLPNFSTYRNEGTSFSAAYVSGAAAFLIGYNQKYSPTNRLDPAMLRKRLKDTADSKWCKESDRGLCSKGMLNLKNALINFP
jgi:subtilisin family serine protease